MSNMMSFRMEEQDRVTLSYLTNQLRERLGNKITRSEVIRLGLILLEELGIDNLERVMNGGNLNISVTGENDS